jgi:hypothetical protein
MRGYSGSTTGFVWRLKSARRRTGLRSVWYAVENDLALFLGDVVIERCPGLEWVMFDKGATDVAYRRHVIMGFSKVANPKHNFDIDPVLATYAHQSSLVRTSRAMPL